MFSTTMLTLVGTLNVSQGLLVAFAGSKVGFDRNNVAYTSAGTWAAATVTLGVLLAVTGLAIRADRPRARLGAVSVVALHAISQLAMLRAYPAWSLLMVTLDVIILFILSAPRGSVVAAPQTPAAKLSLRRNSRSETYRGRHKAGRPPAPAVVKVTPQQDTVIVMASVGAPVNAALVEETVEAELVADMPGVWVRAVGHAAVPVEDSRVPVQRASLESLDPLIDPLPLVLAGEAAIAAATVDPGEAAELAAIGARPYVIR
ncbi:DUF7144 family membrane protein [Dactylosporangium sp. CA-233914]|uniref:DUF7144 family membrane protein n=1 Tax=Dactylosporangium sp. CA-233914 TaxID=3239934 RepID=UPI003D8C9791